MTDRDPGTEWKPALNKKNAARFNWDELIPD